MDGMWGLDLCCHAVGLNRQSKNKAKKARTKQKQQIKKKQKQSKNKAKAKQNKVKQRPISTLDSQELATSALE